jgi:tetratricopeptide (TPR) repeat protein
MPSADEAERARELSAEGQRLLGAGDHGGAVEAFSEAARAFGQAGDLRSQASHQKMVADIYLVMKHPQQALESYDRTLGLLEKLEDAEKQARVLANMGLIEAQSGSGESAVCRFRRSLELFEGLGSTLHVAQQWGNMGSTYRDMQDYDRAMDSYRRALPLYEGLGHAAGMADQYTNMAYVHTMRQELGEALALYQKAVALYTEAGDGRKADLTRQNIATLQSALEKG